MTRRPLTCETHVAESSLPNIGWGVFANTWAKPGDVLEECVALFVPYDRDVLDNYRIAWDDETDAIATGNAELYNHSENPNVDFVRDIPNKMIRIVAIMHINEGDELFIKYRCGPWW